MNKINDFCDELEKTVQAAYQDGVTVDEAERLAARMLGAQIAIAKELEGLDLDSRMKKSGVKAVRAAVYTEEVARHDKKPAEAYLENAVNGSRDALEAQDTYDKVDSRKCALEIYLSIFKDAHIYFRTVSKGGFNG